MRQDRKQKDKPAIALVLCFCLMALVSVFIVKANIDKVKSNVQSDTAKDVVKEQAVDDESETESEVIDSIDDSDANDDGSSSGSAFIIPVDGEITMEYSMDTLIYNQTLDQYMTHSGVDIGAAAGTSVKACAAGTVTRIETDDRLGTIVEINHGNDVISVYGNLSEENLIELGEIVEQGALIGEIGRTSIIEADEPEHLHFEIKKSGEYVDPGEYINGL